MDSKHLPTRYHVTHSCGHQAWWENEEIAETVDAVSCPWCGAETGTFAPYGILETAVGRIYPSPWMAGQDDRSDPEAEVTIIHRADEACCKGVIMPPFEGTR
jgi:hypothetical protein